MEQGSFGSKVVAFCGVLPNVVNLCFVYIMLGVPRDFSVSFVDNFKDKVGVSLSAFLWSTVVVSALLYGYLFVDSWLERNFADIFNVALSAVVYIMSVVAAIFLAMMLAGLAV